MIEFLQDFMGHTCVKTVHNTFAEQMQWIAPMHVHVHVLASNLSLSEHYILLPA